MGCGVEMQSRVGARRKYTVPKLSLLGHTPHQLRACANTQHSGPWRRHELLNIFRSDLDSFNGGEFLPESAKDCRNGKNGGIVN
jgi:hypothetical protein